MQKVAKAGLDNVTVGKALEAVGLDGWGALMSDASKVAALNEVLFPNG
jgi:hypothetical protein